MPARAEVAEARAEFGGRREQIGDQHDEAALADRFGDPLQRAREIGRAAGRFAVEHAVQAAEVAGAVPRRQVVGDFVVEREQADGVALRGQEVGERRGERAGVVALGVLGRAVAHRAAHVDDEVAAQVRFVLEPLDVVAIGAGEEPPVEIARVVAGRVRAVLAELDGEAVVRTAMDAGVETFDDDAGAQLQVLDPHHGRAGR